MPDVANSGSPRRLEIEEVLEAFPGVKEAAVVGRPHPEWGEVPMAFLVTADPVDEAERLCDRVVLIDAGRVVAMGSPSELTRHDGGVRLVLVTRDPLADGWLDGCAGARLLAGAPVVPARGHRYEVTIDAMRLTTQVLERAGDVLELHVHRPDLQDVFFRVTGRALRD
jgi:ABC-type multidrug transport system ATPase subunit